MTLGLSLLFHQSQALYLLRKASNFLPIIQGQEICLVGDHHFIAASDAILVTARHAGRH
jgi:hypothetical protein